MSKRRREVQNRSNTKKEVAVIGASLLIPVAGLVIAPALAAKKVIPIVKDMAEKRKNN